MFLTVRWLSRAQKKRKKELPFSEAGENSVRYAFVNQTIFIIIKEVPLTEKKEEEEQQTEKGPMSRATYLVFVFFPIRSLLASLPLRGVLSERRECNE